MDDVILTQVNRLADEIRGIEDNFGRKPTVFTHGGLIFVSAEDGGHFADYYGEYRGGHPWIHPSLTAFAERNDCYWEWQNPGCIVLSQ